VAYNTQQQQDISDFERGQAGMNQTVENVRLVWSVKRAAETSDLSERRIWSAIRSGELQATKVGGRTLIPDQALRRFLGIEAK